MPIVKQSGDANKIQIEAELLDNITKELNRIDRGIDDLTNKRKAREAEAARASVTAAKSATSGWTEFRSMYSTVLDVVRVGGQVWQETAGKFLDYAEQVRNTSRSLGASAEEASRLIQVADDVNISYSSLTTALKMAQKDGIDPSIDGLAKLADQYTSLAPGVERTKFLLDTFGKSGGEMGKLLEQGGDGVRSMSAAISDSMILTQQAIDEARQFEIAQDSLKDSWDALTYKAGPPLISLTTDLINHYRDITTSLEENGYWYTLTHQLSLDDIAAKRELADAAMQAAEGNDQLSASQEDNASALDAQKEAVKAAEEALKTYKDELEAVSQANQDAESFIQSYADFSKGYAEDHAEALEKVREAEDKLYWVRENNAGKNPLDWQDELGDAVNGLNEAKLGVQELEASWHESTQKMIYDMVLAKVSIDGLTDAEFKATQDVAVQMGIRTQAQADEAKAAMDKANAIVDGIALQEDVMKEKQATDAKMLELENAKAMAAGETTAAVVNGNVEGANSEQFLASAVDSATLSIIRQGQEASITASRVAAIKYPALSTGKPYVAPKGTVGGKSPDERDSGGVGLAGTAYIINPIAAPEVFVPQTNGSFIPNIDKKLSSGGATYNVTIYNPKVETSEASMTKYLRKQSYLGKAS